MKNIINYNQIVENSIKEYVNSLNENEQDELFRDNWAGLKNAWKNRGNNAGFMNNFVQGRNNYYLKKGSQGQYNPQQQGGMQQWGYPQQQTGNQPLHYQGGQTPPQGGQGVNPTPAQPQGGQGVNPTPPQGGQGVNPTPNPTPAPPQGGGKKRKTTTKPNVGQQTQQQIYMFGEDAKVIEHMREVGEEKANEYRDAIKSLAQRMEWYYTHSNEKTYFGDKEDTIQIFEQFVQYLGALHEVYMTRYRTIKPNPKLVNQKRDGAEFLEEISLNPFNWFKKKQPPKPTNRTKHGVFIDVDDKDSDSIYAANAANNLEGKKWIIELRKNTEKLLQYPWFYGKGTTELIKQVIEYLRLDEEGDANDGGKKEQEKKKSGNTLKRLLTIAGMVALPFLAFAPNHANTPTFSPELPQSQIEMDYMDSTMDSEDTQIVNNFADYMINTGQQEKTVILQINGANNRYGGQANKQLFTQRAQNVIDAFAKKGIKAVWNGDYSNNTNGATASISLHIQENKKHNLDKIISEEINRYLRKNLI